MNSSSLNQLLVQDKRVQDKRVQDKRVQDKRVQDKRVQEKSEYHCWVFVQTPGNVNRRFQQEHNGNNS